ncbi:hypothetical protein [Rhodococcus sp. BP22]|uniref:hypothetical protein n=1 Tax=Rhodococcus sp. BP22 TaxID=2758566 RepID=UPI001644F460|nr:hypothetical protein [Rhodococcus sp. BP22]
MKAAVGTKLFVGVVLAGIVAGTVATVDATTVPTHSTTPYGLRTALYPAYHGAMTKYLGPRLREQYDLTHFDREFELLCVEAERNRLTDEQSSELAAQIPPAIDYRKARELWAITLAYGICTIR